MFTLGGQAISIAGNFGGNINVRNDELHSFSSPSSQFDSDVTEVNGLIYAAFGNRISENVPRPWTDFDLGNYDGDVSGATSSSGSNYFQYYDFATTAYDQLALHNDHLTISNALVASVPEPASWALIIGGFGLVGGALRSRRKVTVSFG